jgi:Zn finger protein HypA/HybF involved in hydrogenase expression
MVTFPMIMHQPISENEKVTNVAVVAHNVSGVIKWSVSFTCSTNIPPPDPSTHESKKICGINLGWRQTQDGLRIITIVDQDGRKEHILLDEIVQNRFEFSRALQSELDDTLNDYREMIRDWATSPEIEEDESEEAIKWKELAMKVRRSRTHTSMYDLAIEWRNWGKLCEDGKMHELPDFHPEWFVQLEKWRKADKRKRQEKDNIRIKAIGYRTELYRKLARKLAMEYAVISLGQLNLKKAAKSKKAVDQEDVLPAIARSNRHDCSLYSFNQQLKEQALKHGAILVTAERPVTKTCYKCGYAKNIVPPNDIIYKCKKCGSIYDRDINAATVALQDGISVGITP